ncbi:HAD family hydrolase [Sinirhodobacter huangdaonensis]|uniref:phosphoglycolate phosphatase n=1 Tax=Paenirhodobacter huangdaonensis TaxID=2501515 RepID=A0A3S3M5K3_9RHOB|nr:HAD family hydrolase [Sinirhodobacter huangdaonensis]RWR47717.1 HAD family hydrolase [Sinirhodobacter huangdaonensis]
MTVPDTFLFDCDGVVFDSNRVKTEAFREATLPFGAAAAEAMVTYHTANGGVSRYLKFRHFLKDILKTEVTDAALDSLLSAYAGAVREGLATCAVTPGLDALRAHVPDSRWCIVSGGDQAELREVFAARGLDRLFDVGIFGSPDSKEVILERLVSGGVVPERAVFIGDSRYDHVAAEKFGIPFVFASNWSEFADWPSYTKAHGLPVIENASQLVDLFALETRPRSAMP